MAKELIIPNPAVVDPRAIEMARVWIAQGGLHCSLNVGVYADHPNVDEAVAWGIMLADIARHAANALAQGQEGAPDILRKIERSMTDELAKPTSDMRGGFAGG